MIKSKKLNVIITVIFSALILSSCATNPTEVSKKNEPTDNVSTNKLDEANKVEKNMTAKDGGDITLTTSEGASIQILFPQGSLKNDTNLVAAPLAEAPLKSDDILSKGFSLEEKNTGTGPTLESPVILMFTLKGNQGKNISIVQYNNKEGYDLIPTKVFTSTEKTVLTASLSHFSDYGAKKLTPEEIKNRDEETKNSIKKDNAEEDFNWVIYINDTQNMSLGAMKFTIAMDMKAVNTSGDIEGNYTGSASAQVGSKMSAEGGKVSADAGSRSSALSFNVQPNFTPAPLVDDFKPERLVPNKDDDFKPEPLVPPTDENNSWTANGQITMTTGNVTGTVQAGGRTISAQTSGSTSTLPFTLKISGTSVTMTVQFPELGSASFHGFIRGEGKKEASQTTDDDFVPEPLITPTSVAENDSTTTTDENFDDENFTPAPLVPTTLPN